MHSCVAMKGAAVLPAKGKSILEYCIMISEVLNTDEQK